MYSSNVQYTIYIKITQIDLVLIIFRTIDN